MLRNPLPKNFNYRTNDIIFQIIDWKEFDMIDKNSEIEDDEDEEDDDNENYKKNFNKKLMIRGYGVTDNGNSICIHVENFKPYFYFKIPENWNNSKFDDFKRKVLSLVDQKQRSSLVDAGIVRKKEFYGFTNNKLFNYGIFVFKNQSSYYSFKKVLTEKKIYMEKWEKIGEEEYEFDFSNKLYETKVKSLLRFFHSQDIDPSGWLKINGGDYKKNTPSLTRTQIDITIDYKNIHKFEKNDVGQILVASFDIECCSEDGTFPKPERKNDPVIQIGTTVYVFGDNECKLQYIATLGDCDPIEGAIVEKFYNEKDLILGWAKFIENLDPDILTGYNIWGFDWEYIYKRAETGNGRQITPYHESLFKKLQRIKYSSSKVELTVQDLSSSALGVNILKYIDIEGIVQLDLYKVVQRDYKLDSYKLDNVAKTFMKQQKVDLSPNELFQNFKAGTPDKIKEIAVYCIKDCKLVNDLINKLQVITNNLGMSNVCVVPFSYLFLRGQGIKIFSLVAKFCKEENFLIKDLSINDIDKSSYEGAIVFVPTPGVYFEPVVVMDYNSLYPSSMIAENISHDSILGFKEYGIKNNKSNNKSSNEIEYELIKDTINETYNNLEGYHYIDIEYDVFKGLDDDKKKVGYKVCRFAEADNGDKSVLPRILRKLLKARKDTRKIMEYKTFELKDGRTEVGIPTEKDDVYELFNVTFGKIIVNKSDVVNSYQTNNEFQNSVLDGLQLAYKVTCNSLYGQVGATTSPICYKELAACTTATGRKMVITARDLTLNTFVGAKLTYGDSVTGNTPILVYKNGYVNVMKIEDLNLNWYPYEEFKPYDTNRREKEQTNVNNYKVWTNEGWAIVHRVIRHKTIKKIYRVRTDIGYIDVTEDHSLLDIHKNIIKPFECQIGTPLLCGFPTIFPESKYNEISSYEMKYYVSDLFEGKMDKIPHDILNAPIKHRIKFLELFFSHDLINLNQVSQLFYQSLYYVIKSVETEYDVEKYMSMINNIYDIKLNGNSEVKYVDFLYKTSEDEYVYDIETEHGNFHGGVGQLIVKNTDSIFVNFSDEIRRIYPDRTFTEKELLEESIKIGEKAAANINSHMKAPQNIEYEKTFWPFCIFSKKRYFGNKYEHSTEKYKQTSMGIVLKRRDNAPIVKTIYGGVIDIILNKRDIEASKTFFYNSIKNLLNGKVDISELIISKSLKTDYSNPNSIAHKVLADRMGKRDPGNKPQSNDRIPYCYIDTCNLLCKICNKKINPEKCKCISCMDIYCVFHLGNHKDVCEKACRFCKATSKEKSLNKCDTCNGWYCVKCNEKHHIRTDKYKVQHKDKCKKPITPKLLQGDTIEHPLYITEQKYKFDYNYYLTNQIQKPVYQIFELVMKNPESIIADLVRNMNNSKNGNHNIKDWMLLMGSKPKVENNTEKNSNDVKAILGNINVNINADEDENLLGDIIEEEIVDNMDELTEMI
jgi:DNA polymerase elongation subunit (family B)